MQRERLTSLVLWLVLVTVAVVFSPPAAPDTNDVIVKMLTGRREGVNTSLFALFNLMGVFPMAFLGVLAFDSTEQRVPKWPFFDHGEPGLRPGRGAAHQHRNRDEQGALSRASRETAPVFVTRRPRKTRAVQVRRRRGRLRTGSTAAGSSPRGGTESQAS